MLANQVVERHPTSCGFVMERIKQGYGHPGADLAARTLGGPACLLVLHDRISIVPARGNKEGAPEIATILSESAIDVVGCALARHYQHAPGPAGVCAFAVPAAL